MTSVANFIIQYRYLQNRGNTDLYNVFFDHPMVLVGLTGMVVLVIFTVFSFHIRNRQQMSIMKDTSNRLLESLRITEEQKKELEKQHEELKQVQEELNAIEEDLAERVRDRTEKLKKKNQEIIHYGFINSHLLRAPIARLQGLLDLKKITKDPEERNSLEKYTERTILELEAISGSINDILNDRDPGKLIEVEKKVEQLYGQSFNLDSFEK
jgi:nitrate/nitrite-specific signal transduction histidine kinase